MAFQDIRENAGSVHGQTQSFIDSSIAYYKLWGFKVAMKSMVTVFKFVLILVCVLMVLLFVSVAAAFAIGKALDSYTYGFLIVAAVYAVFTGLLFLIRDKIVEGAILEKFSEIFFND